MAKQTKTVRYVVEFMSRYREGAWDALSGPEVVKRKAQERIDALRRNDKRAGEAGDFLYRIVRVTEMREVVR